MQKEAEEVNDLCKAFQDTCVMSAKGAKKPALLDGFTVARLPTEAELDQCRGNLLYHRQYLCYLLNLQEDLASSIERLARDQKALNDELTDLDALIGGRVSVPKEQVYPRFDAVAKGYKTAFLEVQGLEARARLHKQLSELRKNYFPQLPQSATEMLAALESKRTTLSNFEDEEEEGTDLSGIPGPSEEATQGPVRLTVENSAEFLQVPLDFQGFCIHTLATQNRLLVPGNPALGVIRYGGRHMVFASETACAEFCSEPERYFGTVRDICYRHPELIHLMRLSEDFPRSSLHMILQMTQASGARMQADAQTDTPMHFVESNIDKDYEWNEWKLRREALHMADIRGKTTSATQTALSHLRRESETQVYLPREVATNTAVDRGTNPARWKKYYTGLRGEPQPMRVAEVKFDL